MARRERFPWTCRIERRRPNRTLIGCLAYELERALVFPDHSRAWISGAPVPDHRGRRVPVDGAARLAQIRPELDFIDVEVALFEPEEAEAFFTGTVIFQLRDIRGACVPLDPDRAAAIARMLGGAR